MPIQPYCRGQQAHQGNKRDDLSPCAPTGTRLVKSMLSRLNRRMPPLKMAWPMGQKQTERGRSQRLLLMTAFLARIFDAGLSARRLDAVDRAAFSAVGLDPGVALLHRDRFPLQRLFDETFGFLAHRLLRHRAPVRLSAFMRRQPVPESAFQRTADLYTALIKSRRFPNRISTPPSSHIGLDGF